jgi:hypothetical protein
MPRDSGIGCVCSVLRHTVDLMPFAMFLLFPVSVLKDSCDLEEMIESFFSRPFAYIDASWRMMTLAEANIQRHELGTPKDLKGCFVNQKRALG